jgi:hypothetical protein
MLADQAHTCSGLFAPARGWARWNRTTCPRLSRNSATEADSILMLPGCEGLPQPGGGLPEPSESGRSASNQRPRIFAKRIPQCVYSVYETDAFAAAVAGLPGWLGPACVRAELAHPATAIASSVASTVTGMDFIPHLWFLDPAHWTALPSPRFRVPPFR